jgi:ferredoxin--NADP+ reductase
VGTLLDDAVADRLTAPRHSARHLARLVRRRRRDAVGLREARAIDAAERERGTAAGRPRVKYATVDALVAAGHRRRVGVSRPPRTAPR